MNQQLANVSTEELLNVLALLIKAQPIGIKATKDAIREILADRMLGTTPSR